MIVADPTAPRYWMHETTGALRPAVEAYLNGSMTPEQITVMRAYLRQWIRASVWDLNPYAGVDRKAWLAGMRHRIENLISYSAIKVWIDDATLEGIDPL